MRTIIFGNGDINDYGFVKNKIKSGDYIICCDGGVRHVFELCITPDLILGDLDSASEDLIKYYENLGVPIEKYPSQKDFTDMELCVKKAVEIKSDEIYVFGATGGRLDHTLGNVHALLYALKSNVKAYLIDEANTVCVIDKDIVLEGEEGDIVSLIPLTTCVTGVKTEGLLYPLNFETLTVGESRGISNIFLSDKAKVSITGGYLFVIKSKEAPRR